MLVGWYGAGSAGGLGGELHGWALIVFFCSACWERLGSDSMVSRRLLIVVIAHCLGQRLDYNGS